MNKFGPTGSLFSSKVVASGHRPTLRNLLRDRIISLSLRPARSIDLTPRVTISDYYRWWSLKKDSSKGVHTHGTNFKKLIPNYSLQDAAFLDLFIFADALYVLGGSSAHHQEHTTVHTAVCKVVCSWWRAEKPPETCRASVKINKSRNAASCWL